MVGMTWSNSTGFAKGEIATISPIAMVGEWFASKEFRAAVSPRN